ncbi:MAG TPA: hypothetical protein VEP72_04785 [Microbacterium sp.]|nr:hypothetical protein [Microbacterium sp.]
MPGTPSAPDSPWAPLTPAQIADLLQGTPVRWWLSGGAALARWRGEPIRELENIDVSTTAHDRDGLIDGLPARYSAWATLDDERVAWADAPRDEDLQPIDIHDDEAGAWVLRVDVEDGAPRAWVYKRDPRMQVPWDLAVLDLDGIPTGAPQIQLLWKALRPRPEDDVDKDAVMPLLTDEQRRWWEKAILSIHPHSSWSIPVRSPMFPAKASWNRKPAE